MFYCYETIYVGPVSATNITGKKMFLILPKHWRPLWVVAPVPPDVNNPQVKVKVKSKFIPVL
jgi:hypothetical protein